MLLHCFINVWSSADQLLVLIILQVHFSDNMYEWMQDSNFWCIGMFTQTISNVLTCLMTMLTLESFPPLSSIITCHTITQQELKLWIGEFFIQSFWIQCHLKGMQWPHLSVLNHSFVLALTLYQTSLLLLFLLTFPLPILLFLFLLCLLPETSRDTWRDTVWIMLHGEPKTRK